MTGHFNPFLRNYLEKFSLQDQKKGKATNELFLLLKKRPDNKPFSEEKNSFISLRLFFSFVFVFAPFLHLFSSIYLTVVMYT